MKTSHFEGSIAPWAARTAHGRDERTQRELAAFDINFGGQWLVQPADCTRAGHQPGDGGQVSRAGPVKTGHFDHRVNRWSPEPLPAAFTPASVGPHYLHFIRKMSKVSGLIVAR